MSRGKPGRFFRKLLILIILGGIVFGGLALFRVGPSPQLSVESDLPGIGKKTTVNISVTAAKRGLHDIKVEFVQGERVELLEEKSYTARKPWEFWGPRDVDDQLSFVVGSETFKGLSEGPAMIRVTAGRAPSLLRHPDPQVAELQLDVKLRPPLLQVTSTHTYVTQGGCEVVVYTVDDSSVRDGVQAGEWWFPGYPLPGGGERDRFALFSAPYDLDDSSQIRLVASDAVLNESQAAFIDRFKAQPVVRDTIRLSDGFLQKVVPAIMQQEPGLEDRGSLLQNYLMINGELRKQNAQTLVELNQKSLPEFLWRKTFMQMRNAQVRSRFADRRSYVYNGREVDTQDHLGFDLASTRQADVQAANDGVVVLARYLGIYGNAVAIDHGYGLMSLYGHLSSIAVEEGQSVERGLPVGRSGETGLAGGDHLHFTMQLQGLAVNPREWWDGHWIHDRLLLKLGDALPFEQ